jgi:hypothetical protein
MSNTKKDGLNRALLCQVLNPAFSRLPAEYKYTTTAKYIAIKHFTGAQNFMTASAFSWFYRGKKKIDVKQRHADVIIDFYNKVMAATGGTQRQPAVEPPQQMTHQEAQPPEPSEAHLQVLLERQQEQPVAPQQLLQQPSPPQQHGPGPTQPVPQPNRQQQVVPSHQHEHAAQKPPPTPQQQPPTPPQQQQLLPSQPQQHVPVPERVHHQHVPQPAHPVPPPTRQQQQQQIAPPPVVPLLLRPPTQLVLRTAADGQLLLEQQQTDDGATASMCWYGYLDEDEVAV